MRIFRNPSPGRAHPPIAGFHHQVEIGPKHRWVVLSGQLGILPGGHVPDDSIEQLTTALENVRWNLFAADMQINDVMKLTVYLVGDIDMDRLRAVLSGWLGKHEPTLTILFVAGLVGSSFRVQVDALAAH
ncbi:RidA family protein [Plantactinospora sp. WMMB782]|uniref:RidA family protein n=1 Tax=Plantactinospora sp. WMMB782 TaxID=3404121 RepID=UPI003B943521